jgi:hypothetical protein
MQQAITFTKLLRFCVATLALQGHPAFAQATDQPLPLHLRIKRSSPTGDIVVSVLDAFGVVRNSRFIVNGEPSSGCARFYANYGQTTGDYIFGIPSNVYEAQYRCASLEKAEEKIKQVFGSFVTLWQAEDRMPALSVYAGQSARVIVSNLNPVSENVVGRPCNVSVSFLDAKGQPLGPPEKRAVEPAQTVAINSPLVSGLTRASVAIDDPYDRNGSCAIRSTMEVFELSSKRTNAAISTNTCLGAGECEP